MDPGVKQERQKSKSIKHSINQIIKEQVIYMRQAGIRQIKQVRFWNQANRAGPAQVEGWKQQSQSGERRHSGTNQSGTTIKRVGKETRSDNRNWGRRRGGDLHVLLSQLSRTALMSYAKIKNKQKKKHCCGVGCRERDIWTAKWILSRTRTPFKTKG